MDLLKGLDLFSGIGGITLALRDYVEPLAYCEIDPYCQSVLLQRMSEGNLPKAPIWDDIRTLSANIINLSSSIAIIYGGFPCQDISVAGLGKGLEGERSGLFFEIVRLAKEIKPKFIFLENVPAITTRGGLRVVREITSLGYDCRWCTISAASVGALHRRERWFLLAHAKYNGASSSERGRVFESSITQRKQSEQTESLGQIKRTGGISSDVANDGDTHSKSSEQADKTAESIETDESARRRLARFYWPFESREHWQEAVSGIRRTSDGISCQVEQLRSLGNSVVPQQVRNAFEMLIGIK